MNESQVQERGFAIPAAVLLTFVAALVLTAASTYVLGRTGDHDRRRDRVLASPVVETAVHRLEMGLEENLLAEHRRFIPTLQQLQALTAGTGATLIAGNPLPPPMPPIPANLPQYTVQELGAGGNGTVGYWQMVGIFEPEYAEANDQGVVVIYLRAWIAPANAPGRATEPRLVRVEFRPGRFADYQAVIDGPLLFGPGAQLNGPVHTNGFTDDRTNMKGVMGAGERVATVGNSVVPCSGSGQITTAAGNVEPGAFSGCAIKTNTKRFVNLLATEQAFLRIRKACADDPSRAQCFDAPVTGSSVPSSVASGGVDLRGYRVYISPTSVTVRRYEINPATQTPTNFTGWSRTINTPAGSSTALLFADSVIVSGTTKARLTIAARKPNVGVPVGDPKERTGAANIYIHGDVDSNGASAVMGLISQGGLVLQGLQGGGCVDTINAGMMAMSGTLTVDPRYTTTLHHDGGAQCGQIEIRGSLAAHRSPVLFWRWSNVSGYVGYSQRKYVWDKDLRRNPPPYFPTTETWDSKHVRPADLDCFAGGVIADPDC